ncbi:ABC transporter permease [Teredinibacter waterburyi]|uniref:ABC transporter permease n=1 Tax=Teredinibacter waterburyi TaxID=1500538 RepID=UPI00165F1971|nr:ABC transporter permease [Teredinibacter waterburyi]
MYAKQLKSYLLLDCKLFMREPMVMFFAFVFPALMYLIFGFMFRDMTYGEGSVSYYDQYTASFMGIILLNVALFNIGPGLAIYKERGFFRRLVITPLHMSVIFSATTIRSFLLFLGGTIQIFILGWLMFDRVPPEHIGQIFIGLSLSGFALFSLGFMFGSFFKTSGAAFGASIVTFQVMLMLSGAGMPLEQLPGFVQVIANIIPMKHVVDILRLSWQGSLFSSVALLPTSICVAAGIIGLVVSSRIFRWSAK